MSKAKVCICSKRSTDESDFPHDEHVRDRYLVISLHAKYLARLASEAYKKKEKRVKLQKAPTKVHPTRICTEATSAGDWQPQGLVGVIYRPKI